MRSEEKGGDSRKEQPKLLILNFSLKVKVAQSVQLFETPWTIYIVHGILQARITGMGDLSLLQGISPTQEFNLDLLHCRWIPYQLSHNLRQTQDRLNLRKQRNILFLEPGESWIWPCFLYLYNQLNLDVS